MRRLEFYYPIYETFGIKTNHSGDDPKPDPSKISYYCTDDSNLYTEVYSDKYLSNNII